jgi:isoquinoline 1-oxidoreductase beta subunit
MNPDRWKKTAFKQREERNAPAHVSRRSFVRIASSATGGLIAWVWLPGCNAPGQNAVQGGPRFDTNAAGQAEEIALGAYFRIEPDGELVVVAPKIEMGQGTYTSLPMILADELDADWAAVTVRPALLDENVYGWQGAGGSTSIWESWETLRNAAAAVREMLVQAAAARWNVPGSELTTQQSRVLHAASDRSLSYGELAGEVAGQPVPRAPRLKDPSEFRIIGTPRAQVGLREIVTGRVPYGYDTRAEGMLRACVERAPVFGAEPESIDEVAARSVEGVRAVVPIDRRAHESLLAHGVAVLADSTWAAMQGRRALRIEWKGGSPDESSDRLSRTFAATIAQQGKVLRNDGDVDTALRNAAQRIEAVYELPFLAHAPMEPGNCFADVRADSVLIRGPLQDPGEAITIATQLTGVPRAQVRVELTRLGGGFGRRLWSDYAAEAVLLSMQAKAPVHVVWTREDDIRFDYYRPAAMHRLIAGLDSAGRVTAWLHRQASTSRYASQPWRNVPPESSEFYVDDPPAAMVPNYRIEYAPVDSAVPRGAWRSVIHSGNAFVVQSFIDELAHAAGRDPVEFRLQLLGEGRDLPYSEHGGPVLSTARLRRVLEIAAENAGWDSPPPANHARGIAAHFTFGGYAAQVAEVSVAEDGRVRVHRMSAAIDCGIPVNPSGIRAQVEGCIVFGLSAALAGEITVQNGGVQQSNFHDYPMLRIDRMPAIDVHIVESREPPRGTGEISVPPVAPALANAIFAATGVRLRRPPFTPERFLAARNHRNGRAG